MSMSSNVNFLSLDGRFGRYLTEKERKSAYNAVLALARMQWNDVEEKSFQNEYKFWIASKEDAKDVSFEVKKEITKEEIKEFFDKNKPKFEEPNKLKQMKMFQGSDYVCVAKNEIYFNSKEVQTAGLFSKKNIVYFKNESKNLTVRYTLLPSVVKESLSKSFLKAGIEGGYSGLLRAIASAERTSEVKRTDHKGVTDQVVGPGMIDDHNCPDGKGNYIAFVYDDQFKEWVYFQRGYVKKSVATKSKPEVFCEIAMETYLEISRKKKEGKNQRQTCKGLCILL
ncbi:hypothetical protein AAMO2058_001718100 [Amorphochlora amoebiformis]